MNRQMAGNKIYVQGSYIDIHDNENVYLSVDKAEVRMKDGVAPETASPETPAELQTEEAQRLWDAARDAGWVDDNCQPLLSRALSAVLADRMATLLNIQNKWKVFETFWNRKNMRSDYNDALNQKQFDKFYEKLKKTIN